MIEKDFCVCFSYFDALKTSVCVILSNSPKLVFKARKHDHVQPRLQALYWLPVQASIGYKI